MTLDVQPTVQPAHDNWEKARDSVGLGRHSIRIYVETKGPIWCSSNLRFAGLTRLEFEVHNCQATNRDGVFVNYTGEIDTAATITLSPAHSLSSHSRCRLHRVISWSFTPTSDRYQSRHERKVGGACVWLYQNRLGRCACFDRYEPSGL